MTIVDKSSWPPGPWHQEADRYEWRHLGMPCIITRQPISGHLCGYVGMPPGHPWHGLEEGKIPARVHGGPTYARACEGDVCHVPRPGEPDDVWWVGFDCTHGGDLAPGHVASMAIINAKLGRPNRERHETYRDVAYVREEVNRLAAQARHAQGWRNHEA